MEALRFATRMIGPASISKSIPTYGAGSPTPRCIGRTRPRCITALPKNGAHRPCSSRISTPVPCASLFERGLLSSKTRVTKVSYAAGMRSGRRLASAASVRFRPIPLNAPTGGTVPLNFRAVSRGARVQRPTARSQHPTEQAPSPVDRSRVVVARAPRDLRSCKG